MRDAADTSPPTSSDQLQRNLRFLDFSLRLTVIPLTVASLLVMTSNMQVIDTYGRLEYSNLTGFKYLVWVNAISAGYTLVAVASSCLLCFTNDWVFFVSDQVIAYLMVTSGSAVVEVLYLAHKGDRDVSWSEACDYYGKFCSRAKVSLALHFLALVCFLVLSLISAFRVFSRFEPPLVPSSKEVVEEME